MKDPVRRPGQLFDREYPNARGERVERPGDGVEEEIAVIESNPEAQGDRVPDRGAVNLGGDLERLVGDLGRDRAWG
jgi:hypothetical protein